MAMRNRRPDLESEGRSAGSDLEAEDDAKSTPKAGASLLLLLAVLSLAGLLLANRQHEAPPAAEDRRPSCPAPGQPVPALAAQQIAFQELEVADEYEGPRRGMSAEELRQAASKQLDLYGNPPLSGEFLYGRLEPRGEVIAAEGNGCDVRWDVKGWRGDEDLQWERVSGSPKATLDIAWAVSLFSDGNYLDGAAVLAQSIRETHGPGKSPHRHHFVALVTEEVFEGKSAATLAKLGFRLVKKSAPLRVEDIEGEFLRSKIADDGCCGIDELIKLYSFTLTEFDHVVHLDTDSMVAQNMDELWGHEESMLYTSDYGMAKGKPSVPPVQGGFFVVRPSLTVFSAMVDVVRKGHFTQRGWGDKRVGRFYGGMTIQGLLPYFYAFLAPEEASAELDRCIYNNMVENPRCKAIPTEEIKNAHFTTCQKPWSCPRSYRQPNCEWLHGVWRGYHANLLKDLGLPPTEACAKGRPYASISFDRVGDGRGR